MRHFVNNNQNKFYLNKISELGCEVLREMNFPLKICS